MSNLEKILNELNFTIISKMVNSNREKYEFMYEGKKIAITCYENGKDYYLSFIFPSFTQSKTCQEYNMKKTIANFLGIKEKAESLFDYL